MPYSLRVLSQPGISALGKRLDHSYCGLDSTDQLTCRPNGLAGFCDYAVLRAISPESVELAAHSRAAHAQNRLRDRQPGGLTLRRESCPSIESSPLRQLRPSRQALLEPGLGLFHSGFAHAAMLVYVCSGETVAGPFGSGKQKSERKEFDKHSCRHLIFNYYIFNSLNNSDHTKTHHKHGCQTGNRLEG